MASTQLGRYIRCARDAFTIQSLPVCQSGLVPGGIVIEVNRVLWHAVDVAVSSSQPDKSLEAAGRTEADDYVIGRFIVVGVLSLSWADQRGLSFSW